MFRPHVVVILLMTALTAAADPQDGLCDPSLGTDLNNIYRYSLRGDRCEGLYVQSVAGSSLDLQSLTTEIATYSETTTPVLLIQWPHLSSGAIKLDEILRIRASRLYAGPFYRMDTRKPWTASEYEWRAELLRGLVEPTELGLLAYTKSPLLGERKVVFPVQLVDPQKGTAAKGPYKLGFLPGTTLTRVSVTIAPINSEGKVGRHIVDGAKLKFTPAPEDQPLFLEIPTEWFRKTGSGIYWIALSADAQDSRPLSEQFYLVHEEPKGHDKPKPQKSGKR